jgi:TIR domain
LGEELLMEKDRKTVFISYSWDSKQHQQWVLNLMNQLRRKGIDATMDIIETQSGTVNLNTMMVSNMRNKDYVIIVLTENYAKKSNELQGGVGFETILSLPILRRNPDKLIFVLRHKGNFEDAFPFHLMDYYAIDFSNDANFDEAFEELVYRIYGVPLYEVEPLGDIPELKPRKTVECSTTEFEGFEIPNFKKITDLDKIQFIEQKYGEINRLLVDLFNQIKSKYPNFHFTLDKINEKKHIYNLFIDGELKTGIKLWIGGMFGGGNQNINLCYGRGLDPYNDKMMNEIIRCEETPDKQLILKMTMNMFEDKDAHEPKKIVSEIWKNHLSHYIR